MLLHFLIHPGFFTGLLLVFVFNDGCFNVFKNFKEFQFLYFYFRWPLQLYLREALEKDKLPKPRRHRNIVFTNVTSEFTHKMQAREVIYFIFRCGNFLFLEIGPSPHILKSGILPFQAFLK